MKYCPQCGAKLVDEVVVCTNCGYAVGTAGQIIADVSRIGQKFIDGFMILILGVVGFVYSLVTMVSAISHTNEFFNYAGYRKDLSGPEIMLIIYVLFMISIVLTIVGAVILRSCYTKSKVFAAYKNQKGHRYIMYLKWLVFIGILISFFLPLK